MRYRDGSWHRPYGQGGDGLEGHGFGTGEGDISGEIEGTVIWANFPRRREDGVWTPNLRGVITLVDGTELLISIHGQSVEEEPPGAGRAIVARIELTTESKEYRWLNTCFIVGEGAIDEKREEWWLDAYVCVNEVAQGLTALGAGAPDRFRQVGSGAG
jgi:hypothetical protein